MQKIVERKVPHSWLDAIFSEETLSNNEDTEALTLWKQEHSNLTPLTADATKTPAIVFLA